ncbi:MAG: hypothetical protein CNE34_02260 [Rhodothermaeota bacterium MED-G18]|nr:MAG: hypothetical protein CNE34_02260 [Rhodothermaeota bacterium MED-G18]|tara:strand:+ start:3436 stop:4821 length:1386 start_codon:yes stop_codon:yes gene_type:complete
MGRYLLPVFIFLSCGITAQENTYNGQNIKIKLFSEIDLERGFGVTDNEIKHYFIDVLEDNNLFFTEQGYTYYFSLSHGWKKTKNPAYAVDNFRGLLIETGNDRVVGEFNISKTKNLRESISAVIEKLIEMNNDNVVKKFIDISDHFMKMEMNTWDSSRPDSHAPPSIYADHTHMRGGIMIGYKFSLSENNKIYNRNRVVSSNLLFSKYDNVFESSYFLSHTFEFMYGITDKLTIFSKLGYIDKQTTYSDINLDKANIYSSGFGDINLQFLYSIISSNKLKLHTNIGFDLPSGKFNKSDELPYSMDIGKGYFSSILGFTSFFQFPKMSAGIQPVISLPLNKNSINFNLGASKEIYYWFSLKLNNVISISYSQNYIFQSRVNGSSANLISDKNSDFDVINSGYKVLNNSFGLNASPLKGVLKNIRFSAEYVLPLYQSYNGYQSRKINDFVLSLQYSPGGHMGH